MRLALLVFTLVSVSISSWCVEPFSGFILQNGGQRFLKTTNLNVILTAENDDVKIQLSKLKNNDFISGLGTSLAPNLVRIETIDFVGLNSFLGLWMSPMGIFQVQDFSSLSLYANGQSQTSARSPHASLNYSITPGSGASWVLFLTDDSQIYYSNLTVADSKASIRFFDTQTGAFQREVALSKISR